MINFIMLVLKEGYPFIFTSIFLAVILAVVYCLVPVRNGIGIACLSIGGLSFIFGLFCCFFFRDPKITITKEDGAILSPCNGTVMEVCDNVTEEIDEKVIRVFLSIFSVHLQRSPVNGTVAKVVHQPGKFLAAWDPKAHIENEQNIFSIRGAPGGCSEESIYTVRQIAGLVARRCVSWVKEGAVLKAGDKIGMIKFSSQVDLHLPKTALVNVKPGDKVRAGITIMAKITAGK